jgi:hypothetical protein
MDCNGWLNDTFENPARPAVRNALDEVRPLDGHAVEDFARWWIKTLLLAHHPSASDSFYGGHAPPDLTWSRWRDAPALARALRATGEMPDSLSLWTTVYDADATGALPEQIRLMMPSSITVGTDAHHPVSSRFMVSMGDGRAAVLQLVHHPHCEFVHPFEAAALATRLWPDPPTSVDYSSHPRIGDEGLRQIGALLVNSGIGIHLTLPGHVLLSPDVFPQIIEAS